MLPVPLPHPLAVHRAGRAFAPTDIAGLQVWLDASALIGYSDGDNVYPWPAKSPATFPAFRPGDYGWIEPKYKVNIFGSLPAVQFDGVNDQLSFGDLSAHFPSAATLFIVAQVTDEDYSFFETTPAHEGSWRYSGDSTGYLAPFRSARQNNYPSSMPTTGKHVFTLTSSASTYALRVDGVTKTGGTASYSAGSDYRLGGNGAAGVYSAAYIGEVIAYNSALSVEDRAAVESYLIEKWSLGNNVDAYLHLAEESGALTAAKLNSGNAGQDNYSLAVDPATNMSIVASVATRTQPINVIGGARYPVTSPSKAIEYNHQTAARSFTYSVPAGKRQISIGCWFKVGIETNQWELYDLIHIASVNGGHFVVCQFRNYGATHGFNIEADPGGSTQHSADIIVSTGQTYGIALYADYTGGTAQMTIFNTDGTAVGHVTRTQYTGDDIANVRFGNTEFGASSGVTASQFQDIMINHTTAEFPLRP